MASNILIILHQLFIVTGMMSSIKVQRSICQSHQQHQWHHQISTWRPTPNKTDDWRNLWVCRHLHGHIQFLGNQLNCERSWRKLKKNQHQHWHHQRPFWTHLKLEAFSGKKYRQLSAMLKNNPAQLITEIDHTLENGTRSSELHHQTGSASS